MHLTTLSAAGTLRIPVKQYLNGSGNSISIESTIRKMDADYLVNRNAILVIEQNRSAGAINESGPRQRNTCSTCFSGSSLHAHQHFGTEQFIDLQAHPPFKP